MKTRSKPRIISAPLLRQRGLVLFFALIALVVMSLAAVALVRSVDTSSMIANNMAIKQSGTHSTGAAVEVAIQWISNTNNNGTSMMTNPLHPLNNDSPAQGYYTEPLTKDPLTTSTKWDDTDSQALPQPDLIGNQLRYIIQRMCPQGNTVPGTTCMYIGTPANTNSQSVGLVSGQCTGPCLSQGLLPVFRITVQAKGPRNTLSYVQEFVH